MNKKRYFAKPIGFVTLAIMLVASVLIAVRVGSASMTAGEFFDGLFLREGHGTEAIIIYSVRLPRVIGAIVAGAGLSVSGVLLQSVTGNELAGPNIIGVNAGAGFFVILLLRLLPSWAFLTPLAAFFGAFLTTVFILLLASKIENTKSTVILAGIAITALLNAGISFISLLDSDILSAYTHFSIGGLSGVTLERLAVPTLLVLAGIITAMLLGKRIDVLCLGDGIALSLGIRVKLLRIGCLIIASACAAAVVSFAGLLGFVGLVVPHIARRLCGNTANVLIPVSALAGSVMVVLADVLGRVLFAPSEIPVGIVMAFIGAPFFLTLLLRRKNNAGI